MMPSAQECICCCELNEVVQKLQENEDEVKCITEHEGFEPVCLNLWVLQAAYFQYRQHYGASDAPKSDNE